MEALKLEQITIEADALNSKLDAEKWFESARDFNFVFEDFETGKVWVSAMEKCANLGVTKAYIEIAIKYNMGWGVERSEQKMVDYYQKAADANDGEACYLFALNRSQYLNIEDALTEMYLLKAIELDYHAEGSVEEMLGIFYKNTDHEWFDFDAAANYLTLATEQGCINAYSQLSYLYYAEDFGNQDMETAFSILQEGAEAGQMNCQYNLGLAYLRGVYENEINTEQAEIWLQKCYDNHQYEKALTLLIDAYLEREIIPANPNDKDKYIQIENDLVDIQKRTDIRSNLRQFINDIPDDVKSKFAHLWQTDKLQNLSERLTYLNSNAPEYSNRFGYTVNVIKSTWAVVLEFNQLNFPKALPTQIFYSVGLEYEFEHQEIMILSDDMAQKKGMQIVNAFGDYVKAGNFIRTENDYSEQFKSLQFSKPIVFSELTWSEIEDYENAFHWYISDFYEYMSSDYHNPHLLVLDLRT
jgi:TPR repeat protein